MPATEFEIKEIVLESITGVETDLIYLMDEMSIYEDLFDSTITADFVLDDALNLVVNLPITGHEFIRFSYRTPSKDWINLHLRVYKIGKKELANERRQIYVLHCVDEHEFINAQTRISKAYKGQLISDIAQDLQTNYLKKAFVSIEPTKLLHHIVVPYWTPIKTLNFLATRANSTTYAGSNYVYYQTVDGFRFESIEKLCDRDPLQNYLFQPANVRDQDISQGYKPSTAEDQVAIQSYEFINTFDTLENISHGMYSNRLLWYDIQNKRFGERDFDYPSSYDQYKHVEPNSILNGSSKLWTSKSDFNIQPFGEHTFAAIGLPHQENHLDQWLQQRISQMQQLQNTRLHVVIPGDSDRRVGDLVKITLPSPEALVENLFTPDKFYTNRYLVSSLRHMINKKQYVCVMELVKDSIATVYP